jgi:methylated-DNA-protein-cysteine methyltransferase-like protein
VKLSEKNKDFFQNVFDVVRLIPEGRVTSYGAIAKYLGAPRSSRMVGWAMNASHKEEGIPAHRVVNRNGLLTGRAHFDPPEAMEARLVAEGIEVKENQVQKFKTIFWDPCEELKL